jgi:hypothetical protein
MAPSQIARQLEWSGCHKAAQPRRGKAPPQGRAPPSDPGSDGGTGTVYPSNTARVSISAAFSEADAIAQIEKKIGLEGQPRAIVFHEKDGRRQAKHAARELQSGVKRAEKQIEQLLNRTVDASSDSVVSA